MGSLQTDFWWVLLLLLNSLQTTYCLPCMMPATRHSRDVFQLPQKGKRVMAAVSLTPRPQGLHNTSGERESCSSAHHVAPAIVGSLKCCPRRGRRTCKGQPWERTRWPGGLEWGRLGTWGMLQSLCGVQSFSALGMVPVLFCFFLMKSSIPLAGWDLGGCVVAPVQKWVRYGLGLQTPAGPMPFLGRAVASRGIAPHCPAGHRTCPPASRGPPGQAKYSEALYPGLKWARKTFPAWNWILMRKQGLPSLAPVLVLSPFAAFSPLSQCPG